jgi:hypothetical protein
MNTDQYNEMRARLYMSQHPEATFEQALHEVTKPYEPVSVPSHRIAALKAAYVAKVGL